MLKQLTIRGFGTELEKKLRDFASREGISLNQAVLKLLRKGASADLKASKPVEIGTSLDHLFGTWTDEETKEIMDAAADFEKIDADLWK